MLGFGAVSERPLSTLAAVAAHAIFALSSGYFESPVEETPESYVYQVIEGQTLTGSGAATESADISAGSGSQSTTGTGTATESADTSSGAGSQSLSGAGATTEGADTSNGSGSQSTSGSGTPTEGADTASGSGSGGSSGSSEPVILLAGYYEAAPERVELYGTFVSFVAQSTAPNGSGATTEGSDTSTGVGTWQADAAVSVEFPDEDWTDYTPDSDVYQVIVDPVFDGTGSATEGGDTSSGILTSTGGETFTGGFFTSFERERARREKARRKRLEDEEEASRLKDEVDREIARLLHAQEAQAAEREEMARLAALVVQANKVRALEAFNSRVNAALDRALRTATISALLAFEREVQRQMDAEDTAVLLLLLND